MSFNLYFAGSRVGNDEYIIKTKSHRLYSYINDFKAIEKFCAEKERGPLLVDSGAFSVAHNNKVVDIDKYIEYINNNPQIENFIELDIIPFPLVNKQTVIDSAEGSWKNFLYMIERLKEPYKLLPVFHFGEDLKYLKQILEFKYKGKHIPFICVGGRHGLSGQKLEKYFETIFITIQSSSNPNVKVHILGMTVLSTLEKFPFYSADSTSHLQNAIYGGIRSPYGIINISKENYNKNNYKYLSPLEQQCVKEWVEKFGYTIDELSKEYHKRICFNIDYTLHWAKNYTYKGPKSFVDTIGLF